MTCDRMYHTRADNCGRGLIRLELAYKTTNIEFKKYLDITRLDAIVSKHSRETKEKKSISKESNKLLKQHDHRAKK